MSKEPKPWNGKTSLEILRKLANETLDYTEWYRENGIHLPEDYATDPTTWTEILNSMEYSFELIRYGGVIEGTEDEIVSAGGDFEKFNKGIELFYQYFKDLYR